MEAIDSRNVSRARMDDDDDYDYEFGNSIDRDNIVATTIRPRCEERGRDAKRRKESLTQHERNACESLLASLEREKRVGASLYRAWKIIWRDNDH